MVECGRRRVTLALRLNLGGHAWSGQVGEVRFLTRERVREFPHIQPVVGLMVSWFLGSSVVAGSGEAEERDRFPDMKNPKKGLYGDA